MTDGFLASPHLASAGRKDLSASEMTAFAHAIFGEAVPAFLLPAITRADGRCRERLFQVARAGDGADQRLAVEASPVPIAVINGAADPLIKLDYVESVAFRKLWSGRCHRLNGGGASEIGPDLGQPMAATDYMTEAGIRALVRDPKSVRTWPRQQMPAFPPSLLPDTDLDGLIAYLRQIASQRT